MAIKRFVANKDTTITNAFKQNLTTRATSSNMGASDILEVFTIYAQANTSSQEESRVLVNFPISNIQTSRSAGDIPDSGSVNFFLRLYNAEHGHTLPVDYTMQIAALTKSWDEGYGLDMDEYTDPGFPSGIGSTWTYAASGSTWVTTGAGFYTGASNQYNYTASFRENGTENIEVDVTNIVEDWLSSAATLSGTNGFGIRIAPASASLNKSYYTKKFHARGTEFFFKRPLLEARWNDAKKDNSANFFASSSLVADNSNKLYLYNVVRGKKQNIPGVGTGAITLKLYATLGGTALATATGGFVSTGIYSASITLDNTASVVYPVWSSGVTEYHTGSKITVNSHAAANYNPNEKYVSKITNLKSVYSDTETARFRVFARQKDWSPTIYTVASTNIEASIVEDAHYRVIRLIDNHEVIQYDTSSNSTLMSYDVSGSYFDLDMSMLEKDYAYGINLLYKVNDKFVEQSEMFKFRVE